MQKLYFLFQRRQSSNNLGSNTNSNRELRVLCPEVQSISSQDVVVENAGFSLKTGQGID